MMRLVMAAVLAVAFSALTVAQDKKEEKKTLTGTLVCGKCKLMETKVCSNVLLVKEGDKEVKYYLSDKGVKAPYHKACCRADVAEVKVTGNVVEKDGKKTIEAPKVELPKK